jgi:hypothetical protein
MQKGAAMPNERPVEQPVVRPVPERAVATVTECEACFTPDVCQLRGTCDHYSAEQLRIAARALPQPMTEGELWSWVRSVMSQGADIRCDYDNGAHKTYEHYSMRLDVAAAERAEELWARLKTHNAELTGRASAACEGPR